jgi:hypothetical protein
MLAISPGSSVGMMGTGFGDAASVTILSDFLQLLRKNPSATFYVSTSGTVGGDISGFTFVQIPPDQFENINRAMSAAGRAALVRVGLTAQENLTFGNSTVRAPESRIGRGNGQDLIVPVQAAVDALAVGVAPGVTVPGAPFYKKPLVWLGAAGVIGLSIFLIKRSR